MASIFQSYVVNDGNREAYDAILGVTQPHDAPQNIFIYGPKGSGKTSLMRARAFERDLLSEKKCKLHAATEMIVALKLDAADFFFEEIGSVDVLLVDDFEGFVSDSQIGPMFCRLMLQERARLDLDTVISSEKPLGAFDLSGFGDDIKSFREIRIEPLEKSDYIELASKLSGCYANEKTPILGQDAVDFIALQFSDSIDDVYNSIRFLLQAAGLKGDTVITADLARKLLN